MPTKETLVIKLGPDNGFYEKFTYPAGELQVRFTMDGIVNVLAAQSVTVVANIVSAEDIMELALLKNALDELWPAADHRSGIDPILKYLLLPYLPYARADRRFTTGDCNGLSVFGRLISTLKFSTVAAMDVHNYAAAKSAMWGHGLYNADPLPLIKRSIGEFAQVHKTRAVTILFPDEGARKRYSIPCGVESGRGSIAIDILHCSKKRDVATGKFLGFDIPHHSEFIAGQPVLIVDDICDGGGTFIGIAETMQRDWSGYAGIPPLGLYITHGIFSKGTAPLLKYFGHIYTTNSFEPKASRGDINIIPNENITVYDCMPELMKYAHF